MGDKRGLSPPLAVWSWRLSWTVPSQWPFERKDLRDPGRLGSEARKSHPHRVLPGQYQPQHLRAACEAPLDRSAEVGLGLAPRPLRGCSIVNLGPCQ